MYSEFFCFFFALPIYMCNTGNAICLQSECQTAALNRLIYINFTIEFYHNYTKLVMLSFLYCFVVRDKLILAKSLPSIGIEPDILRPIRIFSQLSIPFLVRLKL